MSDLNQLLQAAVQHHQAGQFAEAEQLYRQILALQPSHSRAQYNLAVTLQSRGRLDEAIKAYRQAITRNPQSPDAYYNLGNLLYGKRQFDEAIAAYRQAIVLRPSFPEAEYNLGLALHNSRKLDEAITAYRRAIALRPNFPEALNNLGNALQENEQLPEAVAAFQNAIALRPLAPEALNNYGSALIRINQWDEGIALCRRAIALRPDFHEAYNCVGNAFKEKGQLDEAIAAYRQSIALGPHNSGAHDNLLFAMNYHPGCNASAIAEEGGRWNRQHAEPLRQFIQPHQNDRSPDRRLRIGYVSPDFREHAVAHFLRGLLAHHDHTQFEIFCYAQVARPDLVTAELRSSADHWHNIVTMPDAQLADQIRREQIDILVDLAGHTANHRLLLFARKPAPIQVTYLGYPASTGLAAVDYRLTDALADPPGLTESLHSEQLFRLPTCAWCYQPPESPAIEPRLQRPITFGCFNHFGKVTTEMLQLWARILQAVPNSKLLLKNLAMTDPGARGTIEALMQSQGVDPARLELLGRTPSHADHLALYRRIDIALDTFPYHGTTTTCEALWMGVPVIALAGQAHVSRVGVSLLTNVGFPELIAETPEQYFQIATTLADDRSRLANEHAALRERMRRSALMDAGRFARDIETAYRQMWNEWCRAK